MTTKALDIPQILANVLNFILTVCLKNVIVKLYFGVNLYSQPTTLDLIERYTLVPDWITLLIFSSLILISVAKWVQTTRFNDFVELVFTNKYFSLYDKGSKIFSTFNLLLLANQIIAVSVFLFLFLAQFNNEISLNNHLVFIRIIGFFTLFIALKFYLEKIIANLFSMDKNIDRYLYQKLSYRNLISLMLLVINLIFLYALKPNTLLFGIIIFVVLFSNILALIYSYKTHEKLIRANIFYFILYLCALEISPYYILYKILV